MTLEQAKDGFKRDPARSLGETQSATTGYIALFTIVSLAVLLVAVPVVFGEPDGSIWSLRKVFIALIVFSTMFGYEVFVKRVYRRNFDFSLRRKVSIASVVDRCLALILCLTIAWTIFFLLSLTFSAILLFFYLALPLILLLAPLYFIMVERHAICQQDELLLLGSWFRWRFLVLGRKKDRDPSFFSLEEKGRISNLLRGIVIKSFFVPVMVISCIHWWKKWELDAASAITTFSSLQQGMPVLSEVLSSGFASTSDLLFILDVTVAMLGYLTSCRFLDTHFVSVEPTVTGWLVALICYPPFNVFFESLALTRVAMVCPESMFKRDLVAAIAFSTGVMVLLFIYSWSTLAFGLRFSNLTNRGIICSGPYRIVRHPAYASKNLAWWLALIAVVYLDRSVDPVVVLVLLLISLTYWGRAITEERHLSLETHYREYCQKVKWRVLPGLA
ncbi:MAG: DUF1295 domain-containing protein [Cyanobacteria bacterium HKST-UBA02]|nr:DUF1295 domain-containing protein [Cyanobacteria bacterium HKST-UBA02]